MTEINKYNYEEYFIDFLDGKLNPSEKMLLMSFLEQNPDLKEELESFENEPIIANEITFNDKSFLKKDMVASDIFSSNFDELCIAKIEGDLNEKESLEFDEFIKSAGKERDLELYKLTKFTPDLSIQFEDKEKLKQKVGRVVKLNVTSILSIAASIVLLIALYLLLPNNQNDQLSEELVSEVVKVDKEIENEISIENKKVVTIDSQNVTKGTKTIIKSNTIKEKVEVEDQKFDFFANEFSRDIQQISKLEPRQIQFTPNEQKEILAIHEIEYINLPEKKVEQSNYISIKSYLAQTFNKRVLNKEDKDDIEMFDIAQAGIDGINKLTGSKMTLERIYDENGNPDKTEFNSRLIAVSTPIKK